ncbi:Protein FAR-RED ELONGATED HYPOCOTYL 3 [Bienertia sinuspersici]
MLNENEWVVRKVVNEHQNHNPTPSKSGFIGAHRKEEMNYHVKRKLKLEHSAGMKTTQRVESINSFFDDYVNKHTALDEFAEMYCRAMEKRAETERQYDAHSETFIRQIAFEFPCESVFQRCYTNMKFKEIQRECSRIMFLHCFQNVVTSDNVTEYTFEDRMWCCNKEMKKEYLTQYKRNYRVRYDMKSKLEECECNLFNHSGIICRHMIKLYDILGEEVPDRYILRRWRKDVSRKHTCVKVAFHDPLKTEHVDTKQLVLEFLELLDIRVDEKRVIIDSDILNQTPSSVCLKDKQVGTPASTIANRKAHCGIPTPESDRPPLSAGNEGNVKDPPRKAKPAHRTTDHRYYSVVEKAIKAKPKQKTKATVSKGTSHHMDVNQGAIVLHPAHSMMVQHNPAPTTKNCQMGLVDTHTQLYRCPSATQDGRLNVSVQLVDPDGSVGLFNHVGRTQRVLFPDNQASTNGSNTYPVDTYLKL